MGTKNEYDPTMYAHLTARTMKLIASGKCNRAILVCGTGIGVQITANKIKRVRAFVSHDDYEVEMAVMHNNAQVVCLGQLSLGRLFGALGKKQAWRLVDKFVGLRFDVDAKRVANIEAIKSYERDLEMSDDQSVLLALASKSDGAVGLPNIQYEDM